MTRPSIHLYSVRDLDESLPETIRRVAAVGFEGVEFAKQLPEADAARVAAALDETGLEAVGAHVGLAELEENLSDVVDRCERIRCERIVVPHLSPTYFRTERRIDALARRLERLGGFLDRRGIELLYHNFTHDLQAPLGGFGMDRLIDAEVLPPFVEGGLAGTVLRVRPGPDRMHARTGLGRLAAQTDPSTLSFEVDVGKAVAAGHDPADVLDHLRDRTPLVHLCDVVPASDRRGFRSVAPTTGHVDSEQSAEAARRAGAEWLVYEHDDPVNPVATIGRGADAVIPLTVDERRAAP